MAIFATHVVLTRNFEAVVFTPGDELPDWAVGQVGAHCLEADTDTEVEADPVPAEPEGAESEGAEPEDEDAAPVKPKTAAAPDFTSAAPRRSKPRR